MLEKGGPADASGGRRSSSDEKYIWHVDGMYDIPIDGFDTVSLEPIDIYEYKQLKVLNCKTPEELIDNFVLQMLERGIL